MIKITKQEASSLANQLENAHTTIQDLSRRLRETEGKLATHEYYRRRFDMENNSQISDRCSGDNDHLLMNICRDIRDRITKSDAQDIADEMLAADKLDLRPGELFIDPEYQKTLLDRIRGFKEGGLVLNPLKDNVEVRMEIESAENLAHEIIQVEPVTDKEDKPSPHRLACPRCSSHNTDQMSTVITVEGNYTRHMCVECGYKFRVEVMP